ncbi:MAG TPA: hypothetical protein VF185_00955 [Patescibacteria group bacterium]
MLIEKIEVAAAVVNLLIILVILLLQPHLPPVVPLFYGLPYGDEQLANTWALIIPPFVALAFIGANIFISKTSKEEFIKQILVGLTVVVTALSAITVLRIILLVGKI